MSEIRVDLITEKTADGGVTIKSTGTGDNKPTLLTLQTSEADIAANDVLGKIQFQAPDEGTGTDAILVSAAIQARSEGDFAADANATAIDFMVGASEAAATKMSLSSAGVLTAVELDISGNVDVDGTTNLDVVDIDGAVDMATTLTLAGNADFNGDLDVDGTTNLDVVDIDGAVDMASTLGVSGVLTGTTAVFASTSADDNLVITSTDADAGDPAPDLVLYRNSSSPADGDDIGRIEFRTRNNNSQDFRAATIQCFAPAVADGSESGSFNLFTLVGGAEKNRVAFEAAEVVFNGNSADIDFRVESNDLNHMLFLNAGSNEIGLGSGNDYSARVLAHQSAADHHALNVEGQNSSYASTALNIGVTRNSSNAYNFIKCEARGFANKFTVRDDGVISALNTTVQSISDIRIKQDITEANSQWDDIKALKFKNFRKKTAVRNEGDDALKELGVIAQDVEAAGMTGLIDYADPDTGNVLDDATFGTLYTQADEDAGNIPSGHFVHEVKEVKEQVKTVKYSIIWMKAVKALQEAQTRIETLETKVAALEG